MPVSTSSSRDSARSRPTTGEPLCGAAPLSSRPPRLELRERPPSLRRGGARSPALEDVREEQYAISGVLRAVARSAGLQPVLDQVVEACRRLCKATPARSGSSMATSSARPRITASPSPSTSTASTLMSSTERRQPGVSPSRASRCKSRTFWTTRNTRTPAPPGHAGLPIMVEDELIGVVVVMRREPQPFTAAPGGAPRLHLGLFCDLRGFTAFPRPLRGTECDRAKRTVTAERDPGSCAPRVGRVPRSRPSRASNGTHNCRLGR
jgi:hypothetical protein